MVIQYRKMELNDIDLFIQMRMNQLQEEGAEAVIDLEPYLQDYYYRHLCDKTFVINNVRGGGNTMFHKMDNQWLRREHFQHYMNNVRCTYSLTVQIDITKLRNILKENNMKAYPAQIYMLASIVNRFKEFRMGISEDDIPGYWDSSHPSYTVFNNKSKTFSSIWTRYQDDFKTFYNSCTDDIAVYAQATAFMPKSDMPLNNFTVSSIPWIDFTAFNLNVYSDGTYLAPIFTLGKYIEQNGKTLIPVAMQLHHSACDGYHAGQFVEALREMAQDCHRWL